MPTNMELLFVNTCLFPTLIDLRIHVREFLQKVTNVKRYTSADFSQQTKIWALTLTCGGYGFNYSPVIVTHLDVKSRRPPENRPVVIKAVLNFGHVSDISPGSGLPCKQDPLKWICVATRYSTQGAGRGGRSFKSFILWSS